MFYAILKYEVVYTSVCTSGVSYRKSEHRYQTKYQPKPGKIPKPNQLKNMREIPTFYRIFSLFYMRYDW